MTSVGVHEAKTNLSDLLRRVEAGEEVIIRRGDRPVARLVAVAPPKTRRLGAAKGEIVIADDFDDPMPDWFPLCSADRAMRPYDVEVLWD